MFRNYLKIAWRQLWRNKFTGAANILGLTIGLGGCLLIGLFVRDELRFDRFVPGGDRIFRVYNERIAEEDRGNYAIISAAFAPAAQRDFPEIAGTLRLMDTYGKQLFKLGEESRLEEKGLFMEPAFFDFFGIPLLEGDPATALSEVNNVVLTESMARSYFGDENPVGKSISVEGREAQITGVMPDASGHFHLDYRYFISFATAERLMGQAQMESWVRQQFITYLKLRPGADAGGLAAKLPGFAEQYAWPQTEPRGFKYIPHLQPLQDIHLRSSDFQWDVARRGNLSTVRALAAIGLFLLLIAVINFVNLSTARAERRAREVGVRKVSGARRGQLVGQFISEALLLALLSTFLAWQAARLLIPALNQFTGKSIALEAGGMLMAGLVAFGALTGVLAGLYPALVLSAFQPVKVLKGQAGGEGRQSRRLRQGLVVVQFSLTVLLIIASLVIYQQMHYLNSADMGFRREQVLSFPMRGDMGGRYEAVKETFLRIPGVVSAAAAYGIPGDITAGDEIRKPGQETTFPARLFTIDHDYISTLGLELVAGRDFSRDYVTDADEAFVLNETAVRELGFGSPKDAIGQRLDWDMWGRDSLKRGQVIGVVRDFNFESLHNKVGPTVLHIYPDAFWKILLRIKGDHVDQTLAEIRKTWDGYNTGYPLEYQFIDESFDAMYQSEAKLSTLLILFTGLTIFVACLGLLGLAIFAAERRTREIGIRKVLGATVERIAALLAREFLKPVLLAILLASPVAWLLLRRWLDTFAYRVDINPLIFLLAGGLAVLIALLTVSFHSLRVALSNPVEALRQE